MVIYAESQPGYAGSPIIVLDGTGVTASGLVLGTGSDGSAIRGFDIINFTAAGTAGIEIDSGSNVVQSNYVGVQADGKSLGQNTDGVLVQGAYNTIGGATAGAGNVISGNKNDNVELSGAGGGLNIVAGNLIGTDVTGTRAVAGGGNGVEIDQGSAGNLIGGTTTLARNILSGNSGQGVKIDTAADSNAVWGNYIGTDISGTLAVANANGVEILARPAT